MKVLILEDEEHSAERLMSLLKECEPSVEIMGILGSVEESLKWYERNAPPDLIFMDIHLSDGSCFELFKTISIESPVIFTTAYDHYAIQAFKVNSIDYIVKPVDPPELKQAIKKYKKLQQNQTISSDFVEKLKQAANTKANSRLVARINDQLILVKTEEIGFAKIINSSVCVFTFDGKKIPVDQSLEQLETLLDKHLFFRINRKNIVHVEAIKKISAYFNGRFILSLQPKHEEEFIVSRDRAADFKKWLEGKIC